MSQVGLPVACASCLCLNTFLCLLPAPVHHVCACVRSCACVSAHMPVACACASSRACCLRQCLLHVTLPAPVPVACASCLCLCLYTLPAPVPVPTHDRRTSSKLSLGSAAHHSERSLHALYSPLHTSPLHLLYTPPLYTSSTHLPSTPPRPPLRF